MLGESFEFFAPLSYFEKGAQHGKDGIIDVKVGGVISDDKSDYDDDIMIQEGMDKTFIKKGMSVLKWEHSKKGEAPTPKNFIGFVNDILHKGHQTTIDGHIFAAPGTPQYAVAQSAVGHLENVQAWNARHPNDPKTVGYSLEGYVAKRSGRKVVKSIITDIVLTTKPKNVSSYAVVMKGLEGGFSAGSAVDIAGMTGGQAGRRQSLEGAKNYSFETKQNKKETKMPDKAKLIAQLVKQGKSKEEAEKMADEYLKRQKSKEDIEKSFTDFNDLCEATLEVTDTFYKAWNEDKSYEDLSKSMEDGLKAPKGDEEFNPIPFMQVLGESNVALQKSMTEQNAGILKVLGNTLIAVKKGAELQKSIYDEVSMLTSLSASVAADNETLRKALAASEGAVVTDNLDDLNVAGEGKDGKGGNDDKDTPKFTNAQVKARLEKAFKECKDEDENNSAVLLKAFSKAEQAGFQWKYLDKSVQDLIETLN